MKHIEQAVAKRLEISAVDTLAEWNRVAAIIKNQVTLGNPTKVPSNMDGPTLICCKVKCNITPKLLQSLFKKAGYSFRYKKTEHEFSYAWDDKNQFQWFIMDNMGQAQLSTY